MKRKVYTLQFLSTPNGYYSVYNLEVFSSKKRLKKRVADFINDKVESGGKVHKYKIDKETYIDFCWNNKPQRFIIESTELI